MKFFISKNKNLPPEAQKSLLPRKEFLTQEKNRFLAAFDASPLASRRPSAGTQFSMFLRVSVGALAVLCVAVGVSAYAATADISATSPLYPIKRFTESVQLAVAPASDQAQLQATFAVQRANEIDALKVQHPSSTLIPQLTGDMDTEISSSLTDANQATSSEEGSVGVFCGAFDKSTSSVLFGHLESGLVLHPNILQNFNQQCGTESHRKGQNPSSNTNAPVQSTTTVNVSGHNHDHAGSGFLLSATSTIVAPPTDGGASVTVSTTITSGQSAQGIGAGINVVVPPVPPVPVTTHPLKGIL